MIERQPMLGGFILLLGLLMIAFNKESARQFEESQKALGSWGMKKHAYTLWRAISIAIGSMLAVLGALLLA